MKVNRNIIFAAAFFLLQGAFLWCQPVAEDAPRVTVAPPALPTSVGIILIFIIILLLLVLCILGLLYLKIRQVGYKIDSFSAKAQNKDSLFPSESPRSSLPATAPSPRYGTSGIGERSTPPSPTPTSRFGVGSSERLSPPSVSPSSRNGASGISERPSSPPVAPSSRNGVLGGSERSSSATGTPLQRSGALGGSERSSSLPGVLSSRYTAPGSSPASQTPLAGLSSATPSTSAAPQAESDTISPLYNSKDKRENRRSSQYSDVFLDIDQDTYSQIIQGEKVQLLFEKRGSYIISPFVCINNSLYINFHFYNENKPITADKEVMLSKAFEIDGILPGKIIKCAPAQMEKRGDKYCVVIPGKIKLAK